MPTLRHFFLDAKLTLRNVKIYLYCLDTDSSPIMWGARDHRLSGPVDRANVACLVITMQSARSAVNVPALNAFDGTISSNLSQNCRTKLTIFPAASASPPLV
jgi:hypothetical protein